MKPPRQIGWRKDTAMEEAIMNFNFYGGDTGWETIKWTEELWTWKELD